MPANMNKSYIYQHTVTAEEIDDLNHAGNFHYVKWMQHAAINVKTWVEKLRSAVSLRCYEITNAKGEMLATAETDWAFVNYARKKPTRIPVEVSSCF